MNVGKLVSLMIPSSLMWDTMLRRPAGTEPCFCQLRSLIMVIVGEGQARLSGTVFNIYIYAMHVWGTVLFISFRCTFQRIHHHASENRRKTSFLWNIFWKILFKNRLPRVISSHAAAADPQNSQTSLNLNIALINKFEKLKWEIDTHIITSWPWLCPETMLRSRWLSGWQPATTQSRKTPSGEVRQLLVTCRLKVLCRNFRCRKNTFGTLIPGPPLA